MSVKIKICGLFRDCDVEYVNEYRPDYAGFVFYPPSHRFVTRERMLRLRGLLDGRIPAVGVFVDVPPEDVCGYLNEGLIRIVQLHGHEDENYIRRLRALSPGCEIWKAFRVRERSDLARARASGADRILLDNGYGTGSCFDWRLLEADGRQDEQLSADSEGRPRPYWLAGGLDAGNVREAIARFHPWGVDVSSGVETDRRKDRDKIREIIEIVRRDRE